MRSVEISLDLSTLPFAPFESSNEQNIDKIDEDETELFSFQIMALTQAEAGVYKIPVKINYYDENSIKQPEKTSIISIKVTAKPIIVFLLG